MSLTTSSMTTCCCVISVALMAFLFVVDASPCHVCTRCEPHTLNSRRFSCHCDQDCELFGDCCYNPPDSCPPSQLQPLQAGVELKCRDVFSTLRVQDIGQGEEDAFLMVTSCPESWPDTDIESSTVEVNCLTDATPPLPPVTDTVTGIVYKNEFCATCNNVSQSQAWKGNVFCTDFGYDILNDTEITLSSLLEETPDFFSTFCQTCFFSLPELPSSPSPTCAVAVNLCLNISSLQEISQRNISESEYQQMVQECESGPLNVGSFRGNDTPFRNEACGHCNGLKGSIICNGLSRRNVTPSECIPSSNFSIEVPLIRIPSLDDSPELLPVHLPFTITLSNLGEGQVNIQTDTEELTVFVNCPAGQAPVGLECHNTLCPIGYSLTDGRCAPSENCTLTPLNASFIDFGNETVTVDGERLLIRDYDGQGRPLVCIDNTSAVFLDCPTALLALNDSDYEDRGNDTIFYDGELVEVLHYDSSGHPLVCPDNTSLVQVNTTIITLLPGIAELTYVGCSLSVLGSVLVLLTYTLFKELRTLPSLLLMNLSLAILVTNLLFIIGGPVTQHFPSIGLCTTVAICLHLFYLAQFVWMSLFSMEMAHTFYLAKNLAHSERNKWVSLAVHMVIGWGLPLGITVVAVGLNFGTEDLVLYGVTSDGRVGNCWINHLVSYVVLFFVPVVLSVVINVAMLVAVSVFLWQSSKTKTNMQKSNRYMLIRVWVAVLSITGLTWVFGFLALIKAVNWAWYFFVIFNSTQGFSIFLAFIFTRKTVKLYASLSMRVSSTNTTETSLRK